MQLSVILITKNCSKTLESCLASVKSIADEIIILDSKSSDNTVSIALRFTDNVIITEEWPGYGIQKQRALDKARGKWVLSLDSDEILTPACQASIQKAIQQEKYAGFYIKRLMIFAGKLVRYSGCSDYPLRLFLREKGKFTPDLVHEAVKVQGKLGKIKAPMLHYSYSSIGAWIEKMNSYSALSIKQKSGRKKYSIRYAFFAGFFNFFKMYFLKRGILDGRLGFVTSVNAGVANYYKYLKLALDKEFTYPRNTYGNMD